MKYFPLLVLALSGCAMSAAGLNKGSVAETVRSSKIPKDFANCVIDDLKGDPQLRSDGDHYWIVRFNSFHIPIARWDFRPADNGSTAELRSTLGANTGAAKVRACA